MNETIISSPFPCLPSGGSTDDQENGHKTWERSAKREETKWLVGRGNDREEKKRNQGSKISITWKKCNIVILKTASTSLKYLLFKKLLLSIPFYVLGTRVSLFP